MKKKVLLDQREGVGSNFTAEIVKNNLSGPLKVHKDKKPVKKTLKSDQ